MVNIAELAAKITTEGVELAAAQIKKFQDTVVQSGDKIDAAGQRMSTLGGNITRNVGLPLAAIGGASIKMALDFDESFTKIGGLVGVPSAQLEVMRERVLGLAGDTARAPAELADALFTVTSAGFRGTEALEVLESAAKAAATGMGDTRTVAETLTAVISAYGPEVITAAEATDLLVATVRAGNFEAPQLASALGQILPVASELDIAFSDVGGSVALLTRSNNNASTSITQVRAVMNALINPSAQATEILGAQGLSMQAVRDTAAGPGGLVAALGMLEDAADGNQEDLARMLGSSDALGAALTILGADAGALEETFGAVGDATGVLGEAFAITAESDSFKAKQAFADLQAAGIALGEDLLPVGIQIIDMVQGLIDVFQGLPAGVQELAAYGIVAGVALGPTLRLAGGVTSLAGQMVSAKAAGTGLTSALTGLNPATVGITVAATAALGIFTIWSQQQAETARNAEELADALIAQGDEFDRLTEQVYRTRLEAAGVLGDFNALGFSIDGMTDQVAGGTDEFEELRAIVSVYSRDSDTLRSKVDESGTAFGEYSQAILEAVASGELSRDQALDLLDALDDVADSADESVDAFRNNAFALLDEASASGALTEALRDEAIERLNNATTADEILGIKDELVAAQNEHAEATALVEEALQSETGAAGELEGQLSDLEQAYIDVDDALNSYLGSVLSAIDAELGYETQVARTKEELLAYEEVLGSNKSTQAELDQAQRDATASALDQADAAVALAEAQAEAEGATLSAEDATRIQIAALADVAGDLAPGSPLRAQLLGYIGDLEGIPLDLLTQARLEGDEESIRLYEAMLDRITADRLQRINVTYSGGGRAETPGSVQADGGILTMAAGGVVLGDRTRPQIGKSGESVLFAEAGDGPESYVPWAPARRNDALGIMDITADAFGYDLTPKGQIEQMMAMVASSGSNTPGNTYVLNAADNGVSNIQKQFARMERRDLVAAFQ